MGPRLRLLMCSPHNAANRPSIVEALVDLSGNVWECIRHGLLCKHVVDKTSCQTSGCQIPIKLFVRVRRWKLLFVVFCGPGDA